jgi:cell division protein FtsQ
MSSTSSSTQSTTRANQVRQRRLQQSQSRMENINQRTHTPAKSPAPKSPVAKSQPVVMRGAAPAARSARPVHQSTRGNVRRQYYYSLDASGVEVRLPAVPMINFGWRLVSGVLVMAMLVGIIMMLSSSMFEVTTLTISGLQRLSAADVEDALDLTGTTALDLNPQLMKAQVSALFPELTDVQVRVGLPAKVQISVRERQPIVAWQTSDQNVWIDAEGVIIPARGDVSGLVTLQADGLPPLTAQATTETDDNATDGTANDMLAALSNSSLTVAGSRMDINLLSAALKLSVQAPEGSTLAYSTSNGLGWTDVRGWKVFIGNDLDNLETKLVEYEAIVAQLTERGITPVMVSVEHLSAPFFRTE